MARWVPLTLAVNSLSRSMGYDDFYPFVIPPAVAEKLGFIHRAVQDARVARPETPPGRWHQRLISTFGRSILSETLLRRSS